MIVRHCHFFPCPWSCWPCCDEIVGCSRNGGEQLRYTPTRRLLQRPNPHVVQILAGPRVQHQDYTLGTKVWSKEPIGLVTRQGDLTWSDFCEWTIQAFIYAQEHGITKTTASFQLGTTTLWDPATNDTSSPRFTANQLESVNAHAVAARGNIEELYNFNLQTFMPRTGLNRLNPGDSPIMYAFPMGPLMSDVAAPELKVQSPTVKAITERGSLNCGIRTRKGFAEFDRTTKEWSGFDVDLCRALSAALFDSVDTRVVFTDLLAAQRFPVLVQERVDVLSRLSTLTLRRDVKEPQTGIGLSFAAPYEYDGVTLAESRPLIPVPINSM